MKDIKLSARSNKRDITAFLEELNSVIRDGDFNINNNFTVIRTNKEQGKEQYSTPYTLLDLNYDTGDIVERLKELTLQEYSETLVDKDNLNPPLLFVFGKKISNKLVYIKLKIKEDRTRRVLCVSFHYAEKKMIFPYA